MESYYDPPVPRRIKPVLNKRNRLRSVAPVEPINAAVSSPDHSPTAPKSVIERVALDKRPLQPVKANPPDGIVAVAMSPAFQTYENGRSSADIGSIVAPLELPTAVHVHSPLGIEAAVHGTPNHITRPSQLPIVSPFVPCLGSESGRGLNVMVPDTGSHPPPSGYCASVPITSSEATRCGYLKIHTVAIRPRRIIHICSTV